MNKSSMLISGMQAMTLDIQGLHACYGSSRILFDLSMQVKSGSVTTLLGRNGMGKTSTINSIFGQASVVSGSIRYNGSELVGIPAYRVAQMGIALVPEGRQIFPNLTVMENLIATRMTANGSAHAWTKEKVVELFPALSARLNVMGSQLSGGEQQMLAIGRALMLNPTLLILDEATEGLAPLIRKQVWQQLGEIRNTGISILLIDKNIKDLLRMADYHYVLEKGVVVWEGNSQSLEHSADIQKNYLGL